MFIPNRTQYEEAEGVWDGISWSLEDGLSGDNLKEAMRELGYYAGLIEVYENIQKWREKL